MVGDERRSKPVFLTKCSGAIMWRSHSCRRLEFLHFPRRRHECRRCSLVERPLRPPCRPSGRHLRRQECRRGRHERESALRAALTAETTSQAALENTPARMPACGREMSNLRVRGFWTATGDPWRERLGRQKPRTGFVCGSNNLRRGFRRVLAPHQGTRTLVRNAH
jgi:hypothetical protein